MNKINQKVVITQVHTGEGYISNDNKYIGPAYEHVVTLKHQLKNGLYITDWFYPEYMYLNNDYIYFGFLIVGESNITLLNKAPEYGII